MFGVVARVDARGLGNQSWEVARNLNPDRVLVVRVPGSEAQGFPPDLDRFPDATVVTVNESNWTLPRDQITEWLRGLDVVYSPETLYDWRIADWARELRCATVVQANPEFYTHWKTTHPDPSQWWAATDWRLEHLPAGTVVVPMPAPVDRFPVQASGDSILHVGGRAATGDRNGTDLVLAAAHMIPRRVTIATQTRLRRSRHVTVIQHTERWWDLYGGHGILLLPRRYGGLCLPVIEACAAGLVPVVTDTNPNRSWPIVPLPVTPAGNVQLPAGLIACHDTTPEAIAAAVGDLDVDRERPRVQQWAADNSWEALRPLWERRLDEATRAKPPKAPSVTVVVPFTPGLCEHRDAAWAWLRNHYTKHHPSWRVVEAHHTGRWCKAEALAVIDDITTDVVIVADADCYIPPAELQHAVARVAAGAPWVVPHNMVRRLTDIETARLINSGNTTFAPRRPRRSTYYTGIAGGGIVVIPRRAWDIAPMDPRFVGWGYEDICWGAALDTLVGPHARLDGDLIHLWHPPQDNHQDPHPASKDLYDRYLAANNLPRRMAALVADREPDLVDVEPVTFRANCRILRVGPRRLEFPDGQCTVTDPDLIDALRRRDDIEEV